MTFRLPMVAVAVTIALTLAALSPPTSAAQTAPALPTLKLPLPVGTAWKVLQGYNGGTHVPGPEQYAFDLVREGGPSAGVDVVAPASGTLWFAHAPGAGNGCVSIKIDNGGGLIVQMCHLILSRVMRPDERITAGQSLGTIGAEGRVGNNGTAHMHLSMHRTPDYGVTRIPAPFAAGNGISLENRNLAPDGSRNQFVCPGTTCPGTLVSTNGVATPAGPSIGTGSGPSTGPGASPAPSPTPSGSPRPTTGPAPSAAPSTAPMRPPATPPPGGLREGVRAVVAGTGDCVNVREFPGITAKVMQCLPDGARLRLSDGPMTADGHEWWRLEGLGWAAAAYLSTLAPALEPGGRARVSAGGPGECLNVRTAPAIASPSTGCLADGTAVRLIDGPFVADGLTWWRVEGVGWVSGEYLTPEE